MEKSKSSFMDKMTAVIEEKIAPVLMRIFNRPTLNIIKNSMVNVMPLILFGSIMLLISLLGTTSMGTEKPILPFLAPFSDQIGLMNNLTMGFMTLFFSVSVGLNYAEEYELDKVSCGLLSLMSFLLINQNTTADNMLDVSSFGAKALFPTMITSILALKIYKTCIQKKIEIRMPDGVPPAVGKAFSSLIPYTIVGVFYWLIRTIFNINLVAIISGLLEPVFKGADNIFVFSFFCIINKLLWGLGIHADTLFQGILDPMKMMWIAANSEAAQAGMELPYIWTTAVERTCLWTGPVLGLLILLLFSKVKHLKTFSIASLPAAFFSIVEPMVFGLPLVMNPILLLPFILSGLAGAIVTYGAVLIGFVSAPFVELPWATPPLLIGSIASGDWKYIILTLINIAIGVVIYYPFVKVYEQQELQRIASEENANA